MRKQYWKERCLTIVMNSMIKGKRLIHRLLISYTTDLEKHINNLETKANNGEASWV